MENWKTVIGSIAVDPNNDQIVYVGGIGIHRSVDGGATWTDFNYGLNSGFVWAILPIPAPPSVAGILSNVQATNESNGISRLFSLAGGQVYAFFMTDNQGQPTDSFTDVPTSYWAWSYIERLANAGITSGCGNGNYCPTTTVTRDQMAVFLLKGKHTSSHVPPTASGVFQDVPTNYWAASWIEQLAAEGITSGCSTSPKKYCPTTPVTRDQMAVFLLKAKHGSGYVPPAPTGMFQDVQLPGLSSWQRKESLLAVEVATIVPPRQSRVIRWPFSW